MDWNLDEAILYYQKQGAPRDQHALTALLKEIQQENNGIPRYAVETAAEAYHVPVSLLLALIRRLPSLRLADTHLLEICAGPNCGKRTELAQLAEQLCRNRSDVRLRYVSCMRMCGKGPNIRWDSKVYHRADEALLRKLIENA